MSPRRPYEDIPEDGCRICRLQPSRGWDCLALQYYHERPGGTSHPGKCWNGRYPDDEEAHNLEEDRETEKQRQAEERRQMRRST